MVIGELVRNFRVDVYFLVWHVVKFGVVIIGNDVKHVVFVALWVDFNEVLALYVLSCYYIVAAVVCMLK